MSIVNGYTTLALVKAELGIPTADTGSDTRIEAAVEAASRRIDGYTGRRFWQDGTVQDRQFYADSWDEVYVDDISTTTGLVVKIDDDDDGTFETTLTISTHFLPTPLNADDDGWPFTGLKMVDTTYAFPVRQIRPGVQVTAKFGWAAVPDDVAQACLIQSVMLYKATDAALGGLSFGDGTFMRLRSGLHPIAADLVERYVLPRVA